MYIKNTFNKRTYKETLSRDLGNIILNKIFLIARDAQIFHRVHILSITRES